MNKEIRVAVTSRSFSRHPVLRAELLAKYKQVKFNESGIQLEGDELIEFLRNQDKAITALESINKYVLSQLPNLMVISKYGVGVDMIDLEAMRYYQKRLGWQGGVNRRSVAELTIAFSIMMLRQAHAANIGLLAGGWRQHVGGLLTGRTVGVIGCGHVGKDLVRLLKAFECRILVNDIIQYTDFYKEFEVEALPLKSLLKQSDIVTLHVPLDDSTRGMITRELINTMKSTAVLINIARGGLVDESALKEALQDGRLFAAAFDVFFQEPPIDYELLKLPNFLATPHIGGSAEEAILAMGRAAIEGLEINALP